MDELLLSKIKSKDIEDIKNILKENIEITHKHIYTAMDNLDIYKLICEHKSVNINHELFFRAMFGDTKHVKILLAMPEINVNYAMNNILTPLMTAIEHLNYDCIDELLKHPDFDINCSVKYKTSALHYTVSFGNLKILKQLLNYPRIDPNIQDTYGSVPIMDCISKEEWIDEFLKYDIKNIMDSDGKTVLDYASKYSNESILAKLKYHFTKNIKFAAKR